MVFDEFNVRAEKENTIRSKYDKKEKFGEDNGIADIYNDII